MLLLTFSKTGRDDVVLTEDDLFDFEYEDGCFSGETFELGGVNARSVYLVIDNNTQRFSRGTFANTRVHLEINGISYGYFNVELPKRRNGVIELTAYDDMTKLDVEYPSDYVFPQVFWSVYAQCIYEAGLADNLSFDNIVNNGVFDNGVISADYTDYIYANSCRQLVSGMAEWNGGFCFINSDGKLQIQPFAKDVTHSYSSGELMELDYSDETVVFSKVKTSQKNKTYEMGDDSGYTLVINNQYIQYGLDDTAFELMLGEIYDYYNGFALTPMTFTLAEPDLSLRLGERISVYDEEEDVTVVGNISKIVISGNLSMQITCGGFGNVASHNNFNPTSASQIKQAEKNAEPDGAATKLQTSAGGAYAETTETGDIKIFNANGEDHVTVGTNSEHDVVIGYLGTKKIVVGGREGSYITVNDGAFEISSYGKRVSVTDTDITVSNNANLNINVNEDSIKLKNGSISVDLAADAISVSSSEASDPFISMDISTGDMHMQAGDNRILLNGDGLLVNAPSAEFRIDSANNMFQIVSGTTRFEVNASGVYLNGSII